MRLQDHALYQVATKALIFNGDKVLVLITPGGYLDFPGGRVDESERDIAWEDALKREVEEEVGQSIIIEVESTCFVTKRQYTKDEKTHHIAAIYFKCEYKSGNITLSDEHGDFAWLTPSEIANHSKSFMSPDEEQRIKQYFSR